MKALFLSTPVLYTWPYTNEQDTDISTGYTVPCALNTITSFDLNASCLITYFSVSSGKRCPIQPPTSKGICTHGIFVVPKDRGDIATHVSNSGLPYLTPTVKSQTNRKAQLNFKKWSDGNGTAEKEHSPHKEGDSKQGERKVNMQAGTEIAHKSW